MCGKDSGVRNVNRVGCSDTHAYSACMSNYTHACDQNPPCLGAETEFTCPRAGLFLRQGQKEEPCVHLNPPRSNGKP